MTVKQAVLIFYLSLVSVVALATSDGKSGAKGDAAAEAPPGELIPPANPVGSSVGPVTDEMLRSTHKDKWLQFGGSYDNSRHSPITSLTPATAKKLKVAWAIPTPKKGTFQTSPIVYGGVMYVTTPYSGLMALDAETGNQLWRYDHNIDQTTTTFCCGPANRGVAIRGDSLIMGTLDAKLMAFDRKTGAILWTSKVHDDPVNQGYSITAAPLVVGDMVFTGIGGGEFGIRGYIDGYDVNSGERKWRFYTVPQAGDEETNTWSGDSYKTGGAPTWTTGNYDPETDTLFWTTGNPSPDWNGDQRKGDNLYSDSVLALDPKTGKKKWHYQFTPHDVWDYDGNSHFFLVDVKIGGKPVKALVQPNRNGFFYIIDRTTGKFIKATKYLEEVNWAKGIDKRGRPIVVSKKKPAEGQTERTCPGGLGGTNGAVSAAYNPNTGLVYAPATESCWKFGKGDPGTLIAGMRLGGFPEAIDIVEGKAHGHLTAIDAATGEIAWRYNDPEPMMAGVLSTQGGVVFTSNHSGKALALNAKTGEELWSFSMGAVARTQPIAYEINGKPYVFMGTGSFGLIDSLTGGRQDLPEGGHVFVFTVE